MGFQLNSKCTKKQNKTHLFTFCSSTVNICCFPVSYVSVSEYVLVLYCLTFYRLVGKSIICCIWKSVSLNVNCDMWMIPEQVFPSPGWVSAIVFRSCWSNRGSSFLLCRVNYSVLIRWRTSQLSVEAPRLSRGSLKSGAAGGDQSESVRALRSSAGPVCMGPNFRAVSGIKAGVSSERADNVLISGCETMLNISDYYKWGGTRER